MQQEKKINNCKTKKKNLKFNYKEVKINSFLGKNFFFNYFAIFS